MPWAAVTIILIGPAPPWRGGIAHHTSLLALELSKRHTVELLTFTRQYPSLLFPGKSQKESGKPVAGIAATQQIDTINPVTWIRTGLGIRRQAPALVVFPYALPFFAPSFGTIAAIARRTSGIRVVYLCHNVVPHERRPGDRMLTKFAFSFADGFVVQSESVRHDLLRLQPDARIVFAHHPVYDAFGQLVDKDEARKKLGLSHRKVLLFFGYVRRYKGLSILLEAIARMEDTALVVAGEFYEDEELYTNLIRRLGIESRVTLVNRYVPTDDIPFYFSAADAVVVPYRSATQSGIIQLAYSFNRPVIASAVGGLTEVVQHKVTGRLVPAGDPDALAGEIRAFYGNGEEKTMPDAVAAAKQAYSWRALADAVESFGNDL